MKSLENPMKTAYREPLPPLAGLSTHVRDIMGRTMEKNMEHTKEET